MPNKNVGILGASSLVGSCILRLSTSANIPFVAFSRNAASRLSDEIVWKQLDPQTSVKPQANQISHWICAAPIWALPEHFHLLEAYGVRRIIVISSTSCLTKSDSRDVEERATSAKLAAAESCLQDWAKHKEIEWVILRPTLIYGLGRDKNISEIAKFIRRFRFFPLFGQGKGLRQPIHAEDVASACMSALQTVAVANKAYNISGGEVLTYRDMVARVFTAQGRRPAFVTVPLWVFGWAVALLRHIPRYQHWSTTMAERMNLDLVFDHSEALRDIGFSPREFVLSPADLPV